MWRSTETSSDAYVRSKDTQPAPGTSIAWLREIVKAGNDDSLKLMERSFYRLRPKLRFTDERQLMELAIGSQF